MCRVIHASSFMSPAQSSPLQTLYFSLSLYIWVGKGKEAMEPREREREMNLPDCVNESWVTFTAGHKKLREASGIKRRNCCYVRIVVLVRSCRTMKLYGVRNVNKSEKRREFIPGPFFSTFAFATFWADYKNTRRQIRKEKRNVENLFFFFSLSPCVLFSKE